jgi:hypothetical protein
MKITALDEFADFTTLDIEKLFSKLKSHEWLGKVILTMMLLLLVRLLLLVLILVAMMLTPSTPLSHLLWSLPCPLLLQLLMNSTRASPMIRSSCWLGSSEPYTSSVRRGVDHLGDASSAVTPPTLSPITPRGRSSTPPTSTTTSSGMTIARVMIRSTAFGTRRRSSRGLCPERVLPSVILTSSKMTPLAQRRMIKSSTSKVTSPTFASWANLRETSPTLM